MVTHTYILYTRQHIQLSVGAIVLKRHRLQSYELTQTLLAYSSDSLFSIWS